MYDDFFLARAVLIFSQKKRFSSDIVLPIIFGKKTKPTNAVALNICWKNKHRPPDWAHAVFILKKSCRIRFSLHLLTRKETQM